VTDTHRMRLGLMLPIGAGALGEGRPVRWTDLREMARTAEAVGVDTLFVPDHLLFRKSPPDNLMQVNMPEGKIRGIWESWTILAALAEATSRIHLGPLVACTGFRNPAILAKMADTLDEVSDGRVILGLGAGWHEPEYEAPIGASATKPSASVQARMAGVRAPTLARPPDPARPGRLRVPTGLVRRRRKARCP
jgi:alkanesulfonate monooxygenase SsuD/methylene tetrahydromethanopterin reductase-like flavin-dependent oxidoreductase (luciferase family)